ncbi:DUF423 domain-containing protein [Flavihumibacter sp. R14]|nr:DUF423 domain-containing protein [Flavihumibacter soli]
MNKRIIITASLFGMLAVILGAFGAHGVKPKISPDEMHIWQTAVDYHFYHVFALLFLSTFSRFRSRLINISYLFFTIGIILFSGSLYILAAKSILGITQTSFIGPVTPVGGLCFIIGWTALLLAAIRNK